MKTFKCSIDIQARNLKEAQSVFYDLTKHWSHSENPKVSEVIPILTPEQQGRIDMGQSEKYTWTRCDFLPTIFFGKELATGKEIGGVTWGVVSEGNPAFSTSVGHFYTLEEAKNALIKSYEEYKVELEKLKNEPTCVRSTSSLDSSYEKEIREISKEVKLLQQTPYNMVNPEK